MGNDGFCCMRIAEDREYVKKELSLTILDEVGTLENESNRNGMIVVHFDFREDKFHIRHVDESRELAVEKLIK